ncbi:LysR family transcriptional regulator [Chitinibacter fontanus]|uniref:LysR family transcriptional regulator n=1 Tax=Chitinibacter fontanus TaxID=1737446 RepID=A0A7D5ZH46_9NEIS|nr:LysR family transcriptional regulator [Chitinibacter fontanus]QLI82288.1 LysR family transcriptional regulator [Chitinibacter fontanus]
MKNLKDLKLLIKVSETLNLSDAANEMNLSPAAVSMAIKRLEDELGVNLLVRSTRNVRLSGSGEIFIDYSKRALELLEEGIDKITAKNSKIKKKIRITMPSDLGRSVLLSFLDTYQNENKQIQFEIFFTDEIVDFYQTRVDLAIRCGLLPDSGLIALPIMPGNRRILCASPEYLRSIGEVTHPNELNKFSCLSYYIKGKAQQNWSFSKGEEKITVTINPEFISNDGCVVKEWARQGRGIAYKSHLDVVDDLKKGTLVQILPDWSGEEAPINLITAEKLGNEFGRSFRDHLQMEIGGYLNN